MTRLATTLSSLTFFLHAPLAYHTRHSTALLLRTSYFVPRTSNGASLGEEVGAEGVRCGEMGKADGEGICRVGGGRCV